MKIELDILKNSIIVDNSSEEDKDIDYSFQICGDDNILYESSIKQPKGSGKFHRPTNVFLFYDKITFKMKKFYSEKKITLEDPFGEENWEVNEIIEKNWDMADYMPDKVNLSKEVLSFSGIKLN